MDWMKLSEEEIMDTTTGIIFMKLGMYYEHEKAMRAERLAAQQDAEKKRNANSGIKKTVRGIGK